VKYPDLEQTRQIGTAKVAEFVDFSIKTATFAVLNWPVQICP